MNNSDMEMLNRQIEEREKHFLQALCKSIDWHVLTRLKDELNFLKEKKSEMDAKQKYFSPRNLAS